VAKSIVPSLDQGWLVDVGCGPGLLAKKLLALVPGLRIVGVDIDMAMINEARSSGAHLIRASADSLPFRTSGISHVVSTTSLKDWAKRAEGLAEIGRVVRPGGTAFVYDFITAGPQSIPPHFVRRFGIVSELLRRATQLVQPFSLQDVIKLAESLRKPTVQVDVTVEQDLAIVKLEIRKTSEEERLHSRIDA
jgi:ubiquinone/menaquinone biosynthesis C-methylase UbiE